MLPQAGLLTNVLICDHLTPHSYTPVRHIPGYWKHDTKLILYVLVVGNFSVKYIQQQQALDLFVLLRA
jgi:hypothetical protein